MHHEVTCEAGMFVDGYTARSQTDPGRRSTFNECAAIVHERGRALSHPDAFAHLYSERWCRLHGVQPLRRPR